MNRQVWLAIGWGVFAVAFTRYAELFFDGWRILLFAQIVFLGPLFEEFIKFIGYRALRRYTLLIALTFAWAEILMKAQTFNESFPNFIGVEMLATAILSFIGSATVVGHIAMWAIPYMYKFRWWTLVVAVLAHSLWNFYFFSLYDDEVLSVAGSPIIAAIFLLFGFALWKEIIETRKEQDGSNNLCP